MVACIYCRRSHMTCDLDRPCARCVKRSIGHLCHDEPRESTRGSKSEQANPTSDNGTSVKEEESLPYMLAPAIDQRQMGQQMLQEDGNGMSEVTAASNPPMNPTQFLPQASSSMAQGQVYEDKSQQYLPYNDWNFGGQNQFQDMHSLHPSYMFNAPDITNEYNLLNEFLSTSLLDDPTVFPNDEVQALNSDPSLGNTLAASTTSNNVQNLLSPQQNQNLGPPQPTLGQGSTISRPRSARPTDKEVDKYYMTIADPSGNDTPEERMNKVFMTKYNAGMLRPFNYIQGYARLHRYMDQNMQPTSRQRILRQLDKFRPKFRERMQSLTDMELTLVEMWFERSLMEYDRVFASMAIPACCWRRTGEIFRGNKEMAELIHVPIEKLRDGKLALHEIIVEKDLVSYWDKFLAIAFDNSQKAMLTTCSLKNPDLKTSDPEIKCCFSFTIRRDTHNIPSLIVGNFLPQTPRKA
ncbi:hypothetical protein ABVK25_009706 [Lepraria finkii]|uniref:Zn(2)-C6 fungal-type domain-containing protein n=1 Tax=Lepraria finkii TaxID=1340010 RepID=A0ABR4AWC7_9LECA